MTDNNKQESTNSNSDVNHHARVDELVARFENIEPEQARAQIRILPYYHQLENQITKPNQGIFVTRYFLTKWVPSLGNAARVVEALRLCADSNGQTFASQETIARIAGVSVRALKRWLSDNENAVIDMAADWRKQWALLHKFFVRSKTNRFILKKHGSFTQARRTTSLYEVAMDDPVHPDDEATLFVSAAQRIATQEALEQASVAGRPGSIKGQDGPLSQKRPIIEFDLKALKGHSGPFAVGPERPSRTYLDRNNVSNVTADMKPTRSPSAFRRDPRVAALSGREVEMRERLTLSIGYTIDKINGVRDNRVHPYQGFHRKVAYFMPEHEVRRALAMTQDVKNAGTLRTSANRYFTGVIKQRAQELRVTLSVEDPSAATLIAS